MVLDFDKYSILINNNRVLLRSAAFHYFRSPGVEIWKDRLSKIKACGYNTVDIYFCWGYHSPSPGVYDFTGIKNIRELLNITVDLGLYVIARPGPYINAELSAGGLPYWLFNVPDIVIRNRKDCDFIHSDSYMAAVREWYSRIIPIINEYQNIVAFQVENEYSTNQAEPNYIQDLYDIARAIGVKVPIFHNDAFGACLYSDIVNIYALDVYPTISLNYDWRNNPYGFGVLDNLEDNIRSCSESSPLFIAELQAGWFDKWDGYGYDYIHKLFGKEHINIVTKTALSQGITMFNHYMGCGGTSWGQLACDEVYTAYDFAAPVSEFGIPQENYYKAKEINYFLNAFNLSSTDLIASEDSILKEQDDKIFAKLRQDNLNNCKWLFIRNLNQERKEINLQNDFKLSLKAFDMKILPLDLNLEGCKLDFSGLSIFGKIQKENHEVIFLLLDENEEIKISDFENKEIPQEIKFEQINNSVKIKFENLPERDLLSCIFSRGEKKTEFIFLREKLADKTWLIENKAIISPDFLLDNPYKAAFNVEKKDSKVKVLDLDTTSSWQHKNVSIHSDFSSNKVLISGKDLDWNFFKCAPEIDVDYDYSNWDFSVPGKLDCISNRIYTEFIWYKGSLNDNIDQIELNVKHCYSIYINGIQVFHHDFLHYDCGKELDELITINIDPDVFGNRNKSEITILAQNMGFNKGFENPPNLPRGIITLRTFPEKEIEWRIRGGLTPEIEEWDFVPLDNLENASQNAYLIWASTNFKLNKQENIFAPLCINFASTPFEIANLYLNGNKIGHYRKTREPQTKFYLIDSFLKENNKLSLIIWNKNNHQKIEDYQFDQFNVNINIEYINKYSLIDLKKFV